MRTVWGGLRGLARIVTILRGCDSYHPLEGAVEVALVGEAGLRGDFGERRFAVRQLLAGELDAEAAQVISDGALVKTAEGLCDMDGVGVRGLADGGQGEAPGEV